MYKGAADKRQTILHRGRPADWVNGEERLTGLDLMRQLQDEIRILEGRIMASCSEEERRALGLQKHQAQERIAELRRSGVGKHRTGIETCFMQLAKEMLPKMQYLAIEGAARREFARRQQAQVTEDRLSSTPLS